MARCFVTRELPGRGARPAARRARGRALGRATRRRRATRWSPASPRRRGPAGAAHRPGRRRADRGAPRAAGDLQLRGRGRQRRRRGGDGARHPGRPHARRAHRLDRRPRRRADARDRPPAPEGERDRARRASGRTWEPACVLGRDLHGATVAIVGGGRIGSAVARRLEGFGCEVVVAGRGERRRSPRCSAASDFVTLHCPLTAETRGLIGEAAAAGDEADRLPGQHRARADRRPGGAGAGAARGLDRRRGARRHRPRAAAGRPPAARRRRTSSSSPTSARPPTAPARRWPTSRSTTCSPGWPASGCPTASTPRSTTR